MWWSAHLDLWRLRVPPWLFRVDSWGISSNFCTWGTLFWGRRCINSWHRTCFGNHIWSGWGCLAVNQYSCRWGADCHRSSCEGIYCFRSCLALVFWHFGIWRTTSCLSGWCSSRRSSCEILRHCFAQLLHFAVHLQVSGYFRFYSIVGRSYLEAALSDL